MRNPKMFAAVVVAGFAFATPGLAMEPMMMTEGQAMLVKPNGESMMFDTEMKAMEMAAEDATPVEEGMIFFMQDGKMMMAKDATMADGKMTSDSMMMMK